MQTLQGSKKGVRYVAFSPDGRRLAASGYDGSLRLWDLSTGEVVRLGSSTPMPKSLSWTPDGQRIVWLCAGSVWWKRPGDQQVEAIGLDGNAGGYCLSSDGRQLFTATNNEIRCRDVVTRNVVNAWPTISPGFLALSPDGRTLASTHPLSPNAQIDAHHVALWDTATGKQTARFLECNEFYDGVAFSPDGTRLAALGHQSVWLWEFPSGRVINHHKSKKFYTALEFSPDSRVLATSGNDGTVRFWDSGTGELAKAFEWGYAKTLCVAFSPDGTRAATASAEGRITIWDVD